MSTLAELAKADWRNITQAEEDSRRGRAQARRGGTQTALGITGVALGAPAMATYGRNVDSPPFRRYVAERGMYEGAMGRKMPKARAHMSAHGKLAGNMLRMRPLTSAAALGGLGLTGLGAYNVARGTAKDRSGSKQARKLRYERTRAERQRKAAG